MARAIPCEGVGEEQGRKEAKIAHGCPLSFPPASARFRANKDSWPWGNYGADALADEPFEEHGVVQVNDLPVLFDDDGVQRRGHAIPTAAVQQHLGIEREPAVSSLGVSVASISATLLTSTNSPAWRLSVAVSVFFCSPLIS